MAVVKCCSFSSANERQTSSIFLLVLGVVVESFASAYALLHVLIISDSFSGGGGGDFTGFCGNVLRLFRCIWPPEFVFHMKLSWGGVQSATDWCSPTLPPVDPPLSVQGHNSFLIFAIVIVLFPMVTSWVIGIHFWRALDTFGFKQTLGFLKNTLQP